MTVIDWIRGDLLGIEFPAHAEALRQGGTDFLTEAFRLAGALADDNRVTRITECREVVGGSTGRKLVLSVEYLHPSSQLHNDLFVKFSRDFDNTHRDAARIQMELEVKFALLSRSPDFPITVPACYFSDYHHESGTGILVTQRIPYGEQGVEPLYPKSLDYLMPDQYGHYRALISALARLAGTHKAGRLPDTLERYFPFDPEKLAVSKRAPYSPEQVLQRVDEYAGFAERYPQLLPANIRSAVFLQRLRREAPRFQAMEATAKAILQSKPDLIAFCHWNAHVDNAWFWTGADGEIECGLMDWGNASQMNVGMALWGCLSAAEPTLWNDHLGDLIQLFVSEYARSGGPQLDVSEVKLHLTIYVAMMGLAWMLDAPKLVIAHAPDLGEATDRYDEHIAGNERARSQLLIMSIFLNLWEQEDMAAVLEYMARFEQSRAGQTSGASSGIA